MATQGPLSPGTASQANFGFNAWSNASNAFANDGANASVTTAAFGNSDWLLLTNFGFSIPTGAVINSILGEVNGYCTSGDDIRGKLFKTAIGTDASPSFRVISGLPTSDDGNYYSFAFGDGVLWGLSWTPAALNASTFGIGIITSENNGTSGTFNIDHVRLTVTYTPPLSALPRILGMSQAVNRAANY